MAKAKTKKPSKPSSKKTKGKLQVAVLMGSASDWQTMETCRTQLDDLGIVHEMRVLSAHRTPEPLKKYLRDTEKRGVKVYICAAGMAAHLAGFVAGHTTQPVIGIPLAGPNLDGLDALLSTVQMPKGVPVATVAIGKAGAQNAAVLAAQILGVADAKVAKRVQEVRVKAAREVVLKDRQLQRQGV